MRTEDVHVDYIVAQYLQRFFAGSEVWFYDTLDGFGRAIHWQEPSGRNHEVTLSPSEAHDRFLADRKVKQLVGAVHLQRAMLDCDGDFLMALVNWEPPQ